MILYSLKKKVMLGEIHENQRLRDVQLYSLVCFDGFTDVLRFIIIVFQCIFL